MYRPQVCIAFIAAAEAFQAHPANVLPTSALNVVATFHLLYRVTADWAPLDILFSLAPFFQRQVRVLLELLVPFTRHVRVALQVTYMFLRSKPHMQMANWLSPVLLPGKWKGSRERGNIGIYLHWLPQMPPERP